MTNITVIIKPSYNEDRREYDISWHVIQEGTHMHNHVPDLQDAAKQVLYFSEANRIATPQYYVSTTESGARAALERQELTNLLQNPLFRKEAALKASRARAAPSALEL